MEIKRPVKQSDDYHVVDAAAELVCQCMSYHYTPQIVAALNAQCQPEGDLAQELRLHLDLPYHFIQDKPSFGEIRFGHPGYRDNFYKQIGMLKAALGEKTDG
jgi:hypothetical protein